MLYAKVERGIGVGRANSGRSVFECGYRNVLPCGSLWWKEFKAVQISEGVCFRCNISNTQDCTDIPCAVLMNWFPHTAQNFRPFDSHTTSTSLGMLLTSNGKEREHTAVSIVVGLRFSLSTAYTLGDMGRRSDGDGGSAESLRLKEVTR